MNIKWVGFSGNLFFRDFKMCIIKGYIGVERGCLNLNKNGVFYIFVLIVYFSY